MPQPPQTPARDSLSYYIWPTSPPCSGSLRPKLPKLFPTTIACDAVAAFLAWWILECHFPCQFSCSEFIPQLDASSPWQGIIGYTRDGFSSTHADQPPSRSLTSPLPRQKPIHYANTRRAPQPVPLSCVPSTWSHDPEDPYFTCDACGLALQQPFCG